MDLKTRIKQLEDEASVIEYKLHGGMSHSTKGLHTEKSNNHTIFISNDPQESDNMRAAYLVVLGKNAVGNKRLGDISVLYKDLITCFFNFKNLGLTLPRWHISKKHAQYGLFDILKAHGYIKDEISELDFFSDPSIRKEIHHIVERIFVRVADAVEAKPPQR